MPSLAALLPYNEYLVIRRAASRIALVNRHAKSRLRKPIEDAPRWQLATTPALPQFFLEKCRQSIGGLRIVAQGLLVLGDWRCGLRSGWQLKPRPTNGLVIVVVIVHTKAGLRCGVCGNGWRWSYFPIVLPDWKSMSKK